MARSILLPAKRFSKISAFACIVALAAIFATLAFAGASSAWAAQEASALHAGDAISIGTAYTDFLYDEGDELITVNGRTSGDANFDPATCVLTLDGLKATNIQVNHPSSAVTVLLKGASVVEGFYATDTATTIKGSGSLTGAFQMTAKTNTPLTIEGGTLKGEIIVDIGSLVMSGGTVNGSVAVEGLVTVKGGTIKAASEKYGIKCANFAMTSGLISYSNVKKGIQVDYVQGKSCDFAMSGGKIVIAKPSTGINVDAGNLTLSGGSIEITDAKTTPIYVDETKYKGKKLGGKINVTSGTLVATYIKPASGYAVVATSMTNAAGTLKQIAGLLPPGATFQSAKNTYKVMDQQYVTLVKYGAAKKKVTIDKVKYGGYSYEVSCIGKNAFNTAAGKKVKSITVKSQIKKIAAYAFAGTKSLKALTFTKNALWIKGKQKKISGSWWEYTKFSVRSGTTVANKALAKMGKNGKGLTVKFAGFGEIYSNEKTKLKKFMKKKGMPAKAKVECS